MPSTPACPPKITFTSQLLDDLHHLHRLILRYAAGDRTVRGRPDRLEGAVQIKFAIWKALRDPPAGGEDRGSRGR
ncbi:MAG: hypothetical protein CME26_08800 [Gemmatimonadetes bacterium]|nr:hypothetical protein [Gemmatimonadota bacterium]